MDKKLIKNNKGFTLTEVMIGIMILTVAIVSASNLLVGLVNTNENNLTTLQAHYYAVEGIEAVRNIRDTNWLHNRDWLGSGSVDLWGGDFSDGYTNENADYSVVMETGAFSQGPDESRSEFRNLKQVRPWSISDISSKEIDNVQGEASGFKRSISISKYQENAVLVKSTVEWDLGTKKRSLSISEILTNWKNGAL